MEVPAAASGDNAALSISSEQLQLSTSGASSFKDWLQRRKDINIYLLKAVDSLVTLSFIGLLTLIIF